MKRFNELMEMTFPEIVREPCDCGPWEDICNRCGAILAKADDLDVIYAELDLERKLNGS